MEQNNSRQDEEYQNDSQERLDYQNDGQQSEERQNDSRQGEEYRNDSRQDGESRNDSRQNEESRNDSRQGEKYRNDSRQDEEYQNGVQETSMENYNRGFWRGFFLGLLLCVLGVTAGIGIVFYKDNLVIVPRNSQVSFEQGEDPSKLKETYDKVFNKLEVLGAYIDKYFLYDTGEVDFADGIFKGYVEALGDRYSTYYPASEFQTIVEKTAGSYCGLGAYVTQDTATGKVLIVKALEGSEAERLGLLPEDVVYSVDGKLATGQDLTTVTSWLKGEEGTTAELVIYRGSQKLEFTVVRSKVEETTVYSELLDGNIGYIQITSFEDVTAKQYIEAVDEMEKKGAKGLIIDLRDNGGGVLEVAVSMADRMIKDGTIVSVKNKAGKEDIKTATDDLSYDKPVVILVNKNSASASEVFSGAMKDHGLAKLVGIKTYGKGIVQSVMRLNDGSAIKLTTAEYFTPNGINIHGTGIEPDVEIQLDTDAFTDGYSIDEDSQVNKAIEVLKGMMK